MPLPASPTILLAAASIALLSGRFFHIRIKWICEFYFLISVLLASYVLSSEPILASDAASGLLARPVWRNDSLGFCEQWLVLVFGLMAGLAMFESPGREQDSPSMCGFLLFSMAGLMLMAASNDFLSLGLSLEIVNLAVMALRRLSRVLSKTRLPRTAPATDVDRWQTADLWFGWLASGWLWFGIAILSNATATTHFDALRVVLTDAYHPGADQTAIGAPSKLILLATGLIAMSLFARMGLVSFFLGFCSRSQGHSHSVNGFVMLAGQLAGSIALTRLLGCVFVGLGQSLAALTMTVSLATFALSATMAVRGLSSGVRSIPRWVASLILLQSAWLGVGLMTASIELQHLGIRWGQFAGQNEALSLIVFTQLSSLLGCGGVCWALGHLAHVDREVEFLEDVKGLGQFAPTASVVLVVALASVIGCPFTVGFWGRWTMLLASYNVHLKSASHIFEPHYGLRFVTLAGIVATMLAAVVVIRIAREMFLESPLARPNAVGGRDPLIASIIAAVACVLFGIAPQFVLFPLRTIQVPKAFAPVVPQRGSGKNSVGSNHQKSFGPRSFDQGLCATE